MMSTIPMPDVAWTMKGFRPVVWVSHRDDGVDPQRPVEAADSDTPYLSGKFDGLTPPLTDDGWIDLPVTPFGHIPGTPVLAVTTSVPGPAYATPGTPALPAVPGIVIWPGRPDTPVTVPDHPIAPVPLPSAGLLLVVGVCALCCMKGRMR